MMVEVGYVELEKDESGREWLKMSRPPGDLWDRLETKHMKTWISEHLRRIWRGV